MTIVDNPTLSEYTKNRKELVVLLHAYLNTASSLAAVKSVAKCALPDADFLVPELSAGAFSTTDPNKLVSGVLEIIDQRWVQRKADGAPYKRIVLVGHSLGALIARKLYVAACGDDPKAPFEPEVNRAPSCNDWAPLVERIVLLAGMNRGWRISHHLNPWSAILWSVGTAIGKAFEVLTRRKLLIFQIRRGAFFITQLRIQWLRMRQRTKHSNFGKALTIQLLGSIDDVVSSRDNIDLVSGGDFIYLDIPHSGHADVINMEETKRAIPSDPKTIGEKRTEIFAQALTATPPELKRIGVIPDDQGIQILADEVTDVIFVVHGIRDEGYWTHKIARIVRKRAAVTGRVFATETSSYGYFPMLPFLFAWQRRDKVEWMMDQYADAVARYPNADFHYVGHSNGTYCLARALELYPCCRFKRVVFAGSVVSRSYDWKRFLSSITEDQDHHKGGGAEQRRRKWGEVESVLNYVATSDWVVAWFPKFFQTPLSIQDLGSAGHDGFSDAVPVEKATSTDHILETHYVTGGHGAGIVEVNWDAIGEFIVTGKPLWKGAVSDLIANGRNVWVTSIGFLPGILWVALGMIIIACGWAVALFGGWLGAPQWVITLLVVLYSVAFWKVITRL
jgi:pimeloyl-ACP methyl ester carboxylesterase